MFWCKKSVQFARKFKIIRIFQNFQLSQTLLCPVMRVHISLKLKSRICPLINLLTTINKQLRNLKLMKCLVLRHLTIF